MALHHRPVHTGPMATPTSTVLASVVTGVLLLGVAAGVLAATRTAPEADLSTPSGVVQSYLQAVADGATVDAAELLDPEGTCGVQDLAQASLTTSLRAVLGDSSVDGDRAVVTVAITEGYGDDPFGSEGYAHDERFVLERSGETWTVVGSPWPMYDCGGSR